MDISSSSGTTFSPLNGMHKISEQVYFVWSHCHIAEVTDAISLPPSGEEPRSRILQHQGSILLDGDAPLCRPVSTRGIYSDQVQHASSIA